MKVERLRWADVGGSGLRAFSAVLGEPGLLVVRFDAASGAEGELPPDTLELWTRSRAVTVAVVVGHGLADPALGVALSADLVFFVEGSSAELPPGDGLPSPALLFAARRAGPRAFRRVVLGQGRLGAAEAVDLGLAHAVVEGEDGLPLPVAGSLPALTAARDLLRSRAAGPAAMALEAAAFRLLFAGGDPNEGARAFLERRDPRFGGSRGR